MGTGSKVIIFILAFFVLGFIGLIIKETGGGAVMSIVGLALFFLWGALFKKKDPEENKDSKDITLNKE